MNQTITINFIAARTHETGEKGIKSTENSTKNSVSIVAKVGKSAMQAATAHDLPGIAADCGGSMTCATCHVMVADEFVHLLPPPCEEELAMLAFTAAPRQPHSRLSCQIKLTAALDGLTLTLPPNQY